MREKLAMSERARLVTAEELERFPDDDSRCELVAGRVVRMTPVGFQHGKVVARLMFLLSQHLDGRNLGVVLTEVGFKLAAGPDTVRAPDVAVIRQHRIPSPEPKGFWNGPPDLAVEVLSPEDRSGDVREKVEEYLACGVRLVVTINPEAKDAVVYRPSAPAIQVTEDDAWLDLHDAIPDFRCRLGQIFEL
jgi:Uma2 family endonuclease